MKPQQHNLNVQSTLSGDKIDMSIDQGALAHIMSVLTNLYSDTEMAVVREYSTNAFDAHVEAGVSLPIEVSLPGDLSPYLKIRDYGLGLNADDIRDIYSRYGTSTKRETNEQIGTLGLGCKSALAYADQFTLQGIKNGIATQVVISRDEDGAGSMTIAAEYETDEASGVLITVPVKQWNSFATKAANLFQFWPEGSVLVNGEEPKRFEGLEIAENTYIVGKDELKGFAHQSVIVMGGVPYTFESDYRDQFSIVAFVELGEVSFTPSREQLQMNSTTKAVVERVLKSVSEGKQGAAQRLVSKATTKQEALDIALRLSAMLGLKEDLTYKGKSVPRYFGGNKGESFHFIVYKQSNRRKYYRKMISTESVLPIAMARNSIFFRGYTNKTLGPNPLAKLKHYMVQAGISEHDQENVILTDTLPNATWVETSRIHDWAQVAAIKLPRAAGRADGRPTGSYDGFFNGVWETGKQAEDFDMSLPTFWFPYECKPSATQRGMVESAYGQVNIVELKANRIAKFERMFPGTRNVGELYREIGQAWFDGLTKDERAFLAVQGIVDEMKVLDAKKIEDPNLKKLIKQASVKNDALLAQERTFSYTYVGEIENINLEETYPLFDVSGLRWMSAEAKAIHMDHTYLYLNAVYNSRQEQN